VKLWLGAVTVAALVVAGCGTSPPSTRLRIEVGDGGGARSYELTCDPDGGTLRQPDAICRALRRNPSLLVGGRGLDHTCPGPTPAYRVSGSYRGYSVDAILGTPSCGWVPGQGDAYDQWVSLLTHRGRGVAESDFAPVVLTAAQRGRRHEAYVRRGHLRLAAHRLTLRRKAQIEGGTLRFVAGAPPDALARQAITQQLEAASLPDGPFPGSVKVYSTTRGGAGAVGADLTRSRTEPVYVLMVRYSYRDYEGHRHLDPRSLAVVMDARTLDTTDIGDGSEWSQPKLGSPIRLRVPVGT
jgi:hypothetical protein